MICQDSMIGVLDKFDRIFFGMFSNNCTRRVFVNDRCLYFFCRLARDEYQDKSKEKKYDSHCNHFIVCPCDRNRRRCAVSHLIH